MGTLYLHLPAAILIVFTSNSTNTREANLAPGPCHLFTLPWRESLGSTLVNLENKPERVVQETNNSARKSKTLFLILKLNIIIFPLYNINERFLCTS